ncbi:hypothetical protein WG66_011141 [Moniliophthora roreri]|nr:hypothetical protein WG66_011141 [Moniliophthora roreri]
MTRRCRIEAEKRSRGTVSPVIDTTSVEAKGPVDNLMSSGVWHGFGGTFEGVLGLWEAPRSNSDIGHMHPVH